MTLRSLVFGCWLDHANIVRERIGKRYVLRCERCWQIAEILDGGRARPLAHAMVERLTDERLAQISHAQTASNFRSAGCR
jgi:hypothetical protein